MSSPNDALRCRAPTPVRVSRPSSKARERREPATPAFEVSLPRPSREVADPEGLPDQVTASDSVAAADAGIMTEVTGRQHLEVTWGT